MSTQYTRCTKILCSQNVAYPRKCEECGLGPCKVLSEPYRHTTPTSAPDQQTTTDAAVKPSALPETDALTTTELANALDNCPTHELSMYVAIAIERLRALAAAVGSAKPSAATLATEEKDKAKDWADPAAFEITEHCENVRMDEWDNHDIAEIITRHHESKLTARNELSELERENRELREQGAADKARMDWIEETRQQGHYCGQFKGNLLTRAAVDAARQALPAARNGGAT